MSQIISATFYRHSVLEQMAYSTGRGLIEGREKLLQEGEKAQKERKHGLIKGYRAQIGCDFVLIFSTGTTRV